MNIKQIKEAIKQYENFEFHAVLHMTVLDIEYNKLKHIPDIKIRIDTARTRYAEVVREICGCDYCEKAIQETLNFNYNE